MSCPCRDFHTIPGSRCWDGVHELPGLAPPAAGVSAWGVTLFVSFLLDPRKCPGAGHLDGAASSSLALPPIFCVFWLNHPAWPRFPEPTASVPVSLSPLALALSLPSWLSPALWARCPPALPAVCRVLSPGFHTGFPFPSSQRSRALPRARSRVFAGVGCRGGRRHRGAEQGWLPPLPRAEPEPLRDGHRWGKAGEGKGGKKRGIERKWRDKGKG